MCVIACDIESATVCLCMQMLARIQRIDIVRQKGRRGEVEVKW